MIKLQPDIPNAGITFYFHTPEDYAIFRNTFDGHGCNVPWKQEEEVPDDFEIDDQERKYMDKPPKERAEDNLSWGFALCREIEKREDMRDGNQSNVGRKRKNARKGTP